MAEPELKPWLPSRNRHPRKPQEDQVVAWEQADATLLREKAGEEGALSGGQGCKAPICIPDAFSD